MSTGELVVGYMLAKNAIQRPIPGRRMAIQIATRVGCWLPSPDHFWSRVEVMENGCWEWQGFRYPTGYGGTDKDGRDYAHRRAFRLAFGTIPKRLVVCHRCDNPPCCNPDHLFLGTYRQNTQDSIRKGRFHRNSAWFLAKTPTT